MSHLEEALRRATRERRVVLRYNLSPNQGKTLEKECKAIGFELVEKGLFRIEYEVLFKIPKENIMVAHILRDCDAKGGVQKYVVEIYDTDILPGFLKTRAWLQIHHLLFHYGITIPRQIPEEPSTKKAEQVCK